MLDIDQFKEYSDAYGHPAGDDALRQFVNLLKRIVRAVDVVARYGGEEFAIVLTETKEADARTAAEKIRAAIQSHALPHRSLTARLGVAYCAEADAQAATTEAFVAMADQALYKAKSNGRNSVCIWEPNMAVLPRQTGATPP